MPISTCVDDASTVKKGFDEFVMEFNDLGCVLMCWYLALVRSRMLVVARRMYRYEDRANILREFSDAVIHDRTLKDLFWKVSTFVRTCGPLPRWHFLKPRFDPVQSDVFTTIMQELRECVRGPRMMRRRPGSSLLAGRPAATPERDDPLLR